MSALLRVKVSNWVAVILLLLFSSSVLARGNDQEAKGQAPKVATNADLLRLLELQAPDDLIMQVIQKNPGNYDLSSDAIQALKNAGLGIDLLQLFSKGNGKPADTTAKPPATTAAADAAHASKPSGETPKQ